MTDIKIKKVHGERELQEQHYWKIVHLQNTWIAVGVILLGLSITVASLSQNNWISVILLLLFGVLICVFSRQIASAICRVELDRMQNIKDTNTRRIVMPNSLKNLATVASWVLFVLGCICFVCGIVNLVLISFNILSVVSPLVIQLAYVGFGILCLVLAYVVARIRGQIE